ncbi:blue copper protein-like [Primulina tabacum]|uniref:blue copper protein-like n=1 Tax=Primulina tabacum TaxID=48773 RepID=UPI003F59C0D7
MASKAFLIVVVVATAVAPTLATDYMVGDNDGWTLGVDYTAWAKGKDFYVGDTIMFMYKEGVHNILKVNGSDFKHCMSSNSSNKALTSGHDVITLATPGNKWYICGIGDHCSKGMQLSITVSGPTPAPTPWFTIPPPPSSSANEISPLKSLGLMVAVIAAYKILITV